MYQKFHNFIRTSPTLREWAYKSLTSPWLANNAIYRKMQAKRIHKISRENRERPAILSIETSGLCNANCKMCTRDIMKRDLLVMDEKLFRKIVDEAAKLKIPKIFMSGFGEPLIDRDIAPRVKYAKQKGVATVSLFTNASLLTTEKAKELMDAGLDEINISIDGFTRETYDQVRPGLRFEQVTANIRNLAKLRRERQSQNPKIFLQVVRLPENKHELKKAMAWEKIIDKVVLRQPQNWAGGTKTGEKIYTPHVKHAKVKRPPCRYLWEQLNVYADGTVALCCLDYDASTKIGNAQRQALKEIWTGPRLRDIRCKHLKGLDEEIGTCKSCTFFPVWW